MLPLYLLSAHMAGDFLLQTRWQAAQKLTDPWVRSLHVLGYTIAFIPVVAVSGAPWQECVTFLGLLAALHWLTDSRRFYSTIGDWIEWTLMSDKAKIDEYETIYPHLTLGAIKRRHTTAKGLKLKPNPWESIPLAVDQTLHLIQIAVLAGWLLT